MIVTAQQSRMVDWLCTKLERKGTPNMRCIGNMVDGKFVGVVGFDEWNGASCQIHIAGFGNWLTREMIRFSFDYAFNVEKVKKIIGFTPASNVRAVRFNKHIGFKVEYEIEDAHPDGSLLVMSMRREECRHIDQGAQNG